MSSRHQRTALRRAGGFIRTAMVWLFVLWCVIPIVWLFSISIKPPVQAFSGNPLQSFTPTLANFQYVITSSEVGPALFRSAITTGTSTAIALALAGPLAYVITQIWNPIGHRAGQLTTLFLAALITPPIVLLVPLYSFFNSVNLVGSLAALACLYVVFNIGLAVLLLRSYFLGVPRELREAALVDGAGEWRILLGIVVPLARGGIAATAILCVIQTWNEFLFASVLVGGQNQTLPVVISSFLTFEGTQWGPLSAAGIVGIIPIVVFGVLVQRDLARGLTFGAVK